MKYAVDNCLTEIKNPNIPKGYGKYETKTFQSPSGNFKVHYYKTLYTS